MKYRAHIFTFFLAFAMLIPSLSSAKENVDYTCYKRGVEIIYPYENAIFKIFQKIRTAKVLFNQAQLIKLVLLKIRIQLIL